MSFLCPSDKERTKENACAQIPRPFVETNEAYPQSPTAARASPLYVAFLIIWLAWLTKSAAKRGSCGFPRWSRTIKRKESP